MSDPADHPPLHLQSALAKLLRPLVRLFVQRGMTFPAVADLLRELYVNVAEYDFALPGKEQTDSRVSLLTGIHRKEIRRLRGAGAPVNTVPASLSQTSRLLAKWMAEFTDPDGRPLALPKTGERSFETLVVSITKDLRARAVLDEWLDRDIVEVDREGLIRLRQAAFVPRAGEAQQLYYFGRNLHDHLAAAVTNVLAETPRFLERAVHYDGLSAPVARQLEERARALATQALTEANRTANQLADTDAGGRWRWNFGIYVYAEEDPPTGRPPDTAGRSAGPRGPDL